MFPKSHHVSFADYELHRAGLGRVPTPGKGQADSAIQLVVRGGKQPLRSCTCKESRKKTCKHLLELSRAARELEKQLGRKTWEEVLEATVWYRLARMLHEGAAVACAETRVSQLATGESTAIQVTSPRGAELARYLEDGPARLRFLERAGKTPGNGAFVDRSGLIARLGAFQITPQEQKLKDFGMPTQRQTWEASFWYRLAYHCVRENGLAGGSFHPSIDLASGDFHLTFHGPAAKGSERGAAIVRVAVPRARVPAVLKMLAASFPKQSDLALHPVPLQAIFRVRESTELDLEVRAEIRALQASGEERFFTRDDLEKFCYGRLVYLPELGVLAELEQPGKERKFRAPHQMKLARGQVVAFLDEHREAIAEGELVLDDALRGFDVIKKFDWVELEGEALERSWYYLSARYGFGSTEVTLAELLEAKSKAQDYLETENGWIDLTAPAFHALEGLVGRPAEKGRFKLNAGELLRLSASAQAEVRYGGGQLRAQLLRRLLELRPTVPFHQPKGLLTQLRPYQQRGVDWLRFLYENGLGGLLCDDMGLGKTHQAMALMVWLREVERVGGPFLVVAPTSVLSHWRDKIRDFAPALRAVVHHGLDRNLETALETADVLVTSYGVLRRDLAKLAGVRFGLAIFDEIQNLKNRDTLSWQAAQGLEVEIKLGLTGTPIENSLVELKALFDLVLPGYLGREEAFLERYGLAQEDPEASTGRLGELRRMISPFVLRRLKTSVIEELPEKIEDVRTCVLSDDQVKLYREAISERGGELVQALRDTAEPLPYIHVFALLNLLKQICDHPALALGKLEEAHHYSSGKWDLFTELLGEALGSGQKVVVFTQYLGMIKLMERHLQGLGVGFVTLTGASRERGAIVDRFNQAEDCRVFLGSLKAGGTGIDLVAGSVVIHYDRWWNAAREDQASDRVHRIGQKRAVQILKLVTEGTLEEKISALIDKKRALMESVVQQDDPKLSKIFSREELLELLAPV